MYVSASALARNLIADDRLCLVGAYVRKWSNKGEGHDPHGPSTPAAFYDPANAKANRAPEDRNERNGVPNPPERIQPLAVQYLQ
jgi:hypothetical protein